MAGLGLVLGLGLAKQSTFIALYYRDMAVRLCLGFRVRVSESCRSATVAL